MTFCTTYISIFAILKPHKMKNPQKSILRTIYTTFGVVTVVYLLFLITAFSTFPKEMMIANNEYLLATGVKGYIGHIGFVIIILGTLLATIKVISDTLVGTYRLFTEFQGS